MRKILVLLILLSLGTISAEADNYIQFCSDYQPKKTIGGVIMSTTGTNLLTRNIIEKVVENSIKKETNSKFKVKIDSFYGTNILNGEFKSFKATAKQYINDGVYAHDIKIETLCPYNKISVVDDKTFVEKDIILQFSSVITKDDIGNMISPKAYKKYFSSINALQDIAYSLLGQKNLIEYKILPVILDKIIKSSEYKIDFKTIKVEGSDIKLSGYVSVPRGLY